MHSKVVEYDSLIQKNLEVVVLLFDCLYFTTRNQHADNLRQCITVCNRGIKKIQTFLEFIFTT